MAEEYLSQINKSEGILNALITKLDKKEVFSQIDRLYEKTGLKREKRVPPEVFKKYSLFGVFVIHKDMFLTKGIRTTAASRVLENYIPPYSATVVKKLANAGAIVLAKANQDAWAHGSSGENSDFGPTQNPWKLGYVPGGSSSGSAAALAAGYSTFTTGTDTGGSIRQPASFCGLVGLKPTYGRVSRYGIVAMASSLDSIGHFSYTSLESAFILQITAGKDPYDATTWPEPPVDYLEFVKKSTNSHKVRDMTIGILRQSFDSKVDSSIKQAMEKVAEKFKSYGAKIELVDFPELDYALALYYIIQPAEVASNLARYDGIRYGNPRQYFGSEAKRRIMLGNYILSDVVEGKIEATSYYKAAEGKAILAQKFKQLFEKYDALLLPTSPTLPFRIGEKTQDPLAMYLSDLFTVPVNIAGLPALNVPVSVTEDNFPVGIQIIAPWYKEEILFYLGSLIEMPWEQLKSYLQANMLKIEHAQI